MGFDKNRFVNLDQSLDENLMCGICLNIFDNAITCLANNCDHTFCKQCVDNLIKENRRSCPECRKCFTPKRSYSFRTDKNLVIVGSYVFKINRMANNIISKLKVKCSYQSYGCKDEIELSLLKTHLKECKFRDCKTCGMPLITTGDHNCVQLLKNDRNKWINKFNEVSAKIKGQTNVSQEEVQNLRDVYSQLKQQLTEFTAKNLQLNKELIDCKQSYQNERTALMNRISAQKMDLTLNEVLITNLREINSDVEQKLTELNLKNLKLDKELIESKLKYENYKTRPISETSEQKAVIIANQETIANLRDNNSHLKQQLTELTAKFSKLDTELIDCKQSYENCRTASITEISAQKTLISVMEGEVTNLKNCNLKLKQQLTEITSTINEISTQEADNSAIEGQTTNLRDKNSKKQFQELTAKNSKLQKELNDCQQNCEKFRALGMNTIEEKIDTNWRCFPVHSILFGFYHDTSPFLKIKFCSKILIENIIFKTGSISIDYKSIEKFMYYLDSVNSLIILKTSNISLINLNETSLNLKQLFDVESEDPTKTYIIIEMERKYVEMSFHLAQLFAIKMDVKLECEAIDSLKAIQMVAIAKQKCACCKSQLEPSTSVDSVVLPQNIKMEPDSESEESAGTSQRRFCENLYGKDNLPGPPSPDPFMVIPLIDISEDSD